MGDNVANLVSELNRQKDLMIKYLYMRADLKDWHGVMDASADIREIEAKLSVLSQIP